ncbi:MAG: hypothetical protein ACRECT_00830 [Thermoplasmata archaeon]
MTAQELEILDLSRASRGEWLPPIGAMGGPPAHELYRDLVVHAGLRLTRDGSGTPWVELQDGEHRRAFPVPSLELRAALDRFRMRRGLRPVPESDIEEFARVVEARSSDPDIPVPAVSTTEASGTGIAGPATPAVGPAPAAPANWAVDELDHLMHEIDEVQGRATLSSDVETESPSGEASPTPTGLPRRLPLRWHTGVSGGRRDAPNADSRLPRYLRALRELVREGTWIGSLADIGRRTGDDSEEVFSNLLRYHTDLVGNNLVVAPVEVEDGWRWIVVDRGRLRSSPSDPPAWP